MKNVAFSQSGSTPLPGRASFILRRGVTVSALAMFALAGIAQNSSYNLNSIPIGGVDNSAFGFNSSPVVTGLQNAGFGKNTLRSLTIGGQNSAIGVESMSGATTGSMNTAVGFIAMVGTTTGTANTSLGVRTLTGNVTGSNNTAVGWTANVAAANLNNATALGNGAIVNASNKIRLGNAAVTVIEGQVAYTFPSDGRFKFNVSETDVKGLDFITRLRPVVYNFDAARYEEFLCKNMPDADRKLYMGADFAPATAVRQSGFIAQEVEQAAKETGYNFNGVHAPENADDHYSVAYSQFVVPLVKAVQEQQAMIDAQQQQIDELQRLVEALASSSKAQIGGGSSSQDVQVFPNPSNGVFTLTTKQMTGATVEVFDLGGKRIHSATLQPDATTHRVDLSNQARGTYIVKVTASGKEVSTQSVILQ